jgi:ubiquinone/menaquinone biosynthesis C-methylase UbiE
MPTASFREYSGTAAELYQSFFVPAIATPASDELLRTADLRAGERVLDVACGTGIITRAAAEQVGQTGTVTAIDLAPDMLEVAKATPAAGAPIEWHQADAASLPLPDASYDVALCQMGVMFMEDRTGALAELHRVLTPGGRVVINTPGRIQPLFKAMEQAIVEHIGPELGAFVSAVFSMHDPSALAVLLGDTGFTDVSSKEYTAHFTLPGPAKFLWNYINLTPMGPIVAGASEEAKAAMERQVVEAWTPHVIDETTPLDQPIALAWGRRS